MEGVERYVGVGISRFAVGLKSHLKRDPGPRPSLNRVPFQGHPQVEEVILGMILGCHHSMIRGFAVRVVACPFKTDVWVSSGQCLSELAQRHQRADPDEEKVVYVPLVKLDA